MCRQPHFRYANDASIWHSVYENNEYLLGPECLTSHTVLDIGAHIGSFAAKAVDCGAKLVVSLEPNASSRETYRKNLAEEILCGKAILLPHACWCDGGQTMTLHACPLADSPSGDTLVLHSGGGEPVQTASLCTLLQLFQPTALKMDCEGAEYFAFLSVAGIPAFVQIAWVEFHQLDLMEARFYGAVNMFIASGFKAQKIGEFDTLTHLWRFVR